MKKLVTLVLCFLAFYSSQAQDVTARVMVLPPYPNNIQDLLTRQFDNIFELQNNTNATREVFIGLRVFSNNGINIATAPGSKSTRPIVLQPMGLTRLSGAQMEDFIRGNELQYSGINKDDVIRKRAIPEGEYQICLTVYDYATNAQIGQEVCSAPISIMSLEPPVLRVTSPMREDTISNTTPQNVQFQWTTPPGINVYRDYTVKFKLKLVEVPEGVDPNQAVLMSPGVTPEITLRQTNYFTYGPEKAPLKLGQRYAAVIQIFDSRGKYNFRNDGRSEVITFVYGKFMSKEEIEKIEEEKRKEEERIKMKDRYKGQVKWAFVDEKRPSENTSIVAISTYAAGQSKVYNSTTNFKGAKLEAKTYPWRNSNIAIYASNNSYVAPPHFPYSQKIRGKRLVGTAKTDAEGNFDAYFFLKGAYSRYKYFFLEINPDNSFNSYFERVSMSETDSGFNLGVHTIRAHTLFFAPKIVMPTYQKSSKVEVNLLVKKSTVSAYPFYEQFEDFERKTISYNNADYYIIKKLKSTEYISTFANADGRYVLMAESNGKRVFKPLTRRNTSLNNVVIERLILELNEAVFFKGVVTYKGVPRSNVKVSVTVNTKELTGLFEYKYPKWSKRHGVTIEYIGYTDAEGKYTIRLPAIAKGAKITYTFADKTIRHSTWTDQINYEEQNTIEFDRVLENKMIMVVGRTKTTEGAVVKNALLSSSIYPVDVHSSNDGLFLFKISEEDAKSISFSVQADEMVSNKLRLTNGESISLSEKMVSASEWENGLKKCNSVSTFINSGVSNLSPEHFAYTQSSMSELYGVLNSGQDAIVKILDVGEVKLVDKRGELTVTMLPGVGMKKPTLGLITISNGDVDTVTSGTMYVYKATTGKYTFEITPLEEDNLFVPFSGEFSISPSKKKEYTFMLTNAIAITGKVVVFDDVNQKETDTVIANASIKIEGTELSATTNDKGEYKMYVQANEDFRYVVRKDGFNTSKITKNFEESSTFNFYISRRDPNAPEIHRMLGYRVSLDKLEKSGSEDVYIVSGELYIQNNPLFKVSGGDSILHFVDVPVLMDTYDSLNSIPQDKVNFDEVSLSAMAYGYMPISVLGNPSIQMRALSSAKASVKNRGVIGGKAFKAGVSKLKVGGAVPLNIKNFYFKIQNEDDKYLTDKINKSVNAEGKSKEELDALKTSISTMMSGYDFEYAFATPGTVMPYLTRSTKFNVSLSSPDFSKKIKIGDKKKDKDTTFNKDNYIECSAVVFKFFLEKEGITMDSTGMYMKGLFEFDKKIQGATFPKGKINMPEFVLGKQFEIKRMVIEVHDTSAIDVKLHKWLLKVNKAIILGIGSVNMGIGFGGHLHFKTDDQGNLNKAEALTIKELSLQKVSGGVSFVGDFILPEKGISFSKLNFTTPAEVGSGSLKLTYKSDINSFEFKGSGRLKYGTDSSTSVMKDIFPVDIQTFQFRSSDLSFLLHAKANAQVDLKVAKLNISQFLINIGYGLSKSAISDMLKRSKDDKKGFFNSSSFKGITKDSVARVQQVIDNIRAAGKTPPKRYTDFVNQQIAKGTVTRKELKDLMSLGAGSTDKPIHGKAVAWGIGIQGDVSFGVKGIETKAGATLIVTGGSKGVEVQLDEILLNVSSPAFSLKVEAKMAFGPKKQGFEGSGELELLKKSLGASFKFYHYAATSKSKAGIEVGASILVSAGITTGPVTWHSIGGGFDFNTVTDKYMVFVMGELGPSGTPKESVYLNKVKLSVLFDAKKCGAAPIVEGSAGISLLEEEWGIIKAKLDFCRMFMLITFDNDVSVLNGASTVRVKGIAYGLAPQTGRQGSIFLGVNAKIAIPSIGQGNGTLAVGINFNKEEKNTPQDIKDFWSNISKDATDGYRDEKLNAIYANVGIKVPKKTGSLNVSVGDLKALSLNYHFSASGEADLYIKFATGELKAKANLHADAGAKLTILSVIKLNGDASADINLSGGWNKTDLWYFNGDAQLKFKLYTSNSPACNSIETKWKTPSWRCSYWCGPAICCAWDKTCYKTCYGIPYPVVNYKICANVKAGFKFKQNQAPKVSVSLN